MHEAAKPWLDLAYQDLLAAKVLYEEGIYNLVCFHAQQCVEKSLKGLLVALGHPPPRLHSVSELLRLIPANLFSDLSQNLAIFDDYYIPVRYPDALPGSLPYGLPGEQEARVALELAEVVMKKVLDQLRTL